MNYLASSSFYDYESGEIQALVAEFKDSKRSQSKIAEQVYLKVRDGWRYNPYRISLRAEDYLASAIAKKKEGHCIEKSVLLIACYRALGLPARLHLAKVKNHIGVERLLEKFGSNELTPHGMVNVLIDGKWLKASPAFNAELCVMVGVDPLDFNGKEDSIFQEYNKAGHQFMEYLEDYGHFADVPVDFIKQNFQENYPHIFAQVKDKGYIEL
ncbi:MAG: transglutaminase-like domain-containing protein [Bacteroidota bacterium]